MDGLRISDSQASPHRAYYGPRARASLGQNQRSLEAAQWAGRASCAFPKHGIAAAQGGCGARHGSGPC
jgi:hypothetical protein